MPSTGRASQTSPTSCQPSQEIQNNRVVEAGNQQCPVTLVRELVEKAWNIVFEVKHILTRPRPKPCFTSPHDKAQGVEHKTVQNDRKFVMENSVSCCVGLNERKDKKEEAMNELGHHNYNVYSNVGLSRRAA